MVDSCQLIIRQLLYLEFPITGRALNAVQQQFWHYFDNKKIYMFALLLKIVDN